MSRTALIAGASGIVGNNLAQLLVAKGWQVHGLARRPPTDIPGLQPVAADLLDPRSLRDGAEERDAQATSSSPTWLRQATEAENIRVNGAMVRNLLDALSPARLAAARRAGDRAEALSRPVRGLRQGHPAGDAVPRGAAAAGRREFLLRPGGRGLFAAAERDGFGWSVHRPHTIIG